MIFKLDMIDKIFLDKHSDQRGDLFVIEENLKINLEFKKYYILEFENHIDEIKESEVLIVLRGYIYFKDEKIVKGQMIIGGEHRETIKVSDDIICLYLSNYVHDLTIVSGFNFPVKRIFFVDNMPSGSIRGNHAHKIETEFLYIVKGDFKVDIKDGNNNLSKTLSVGETAVSHPNAWTSVVPISEDGILLALLSHKYNASGFIK